MYDTFAATSGRFFFLKALGCCTSHRAFNFHHVELKDLALAALAAVQKTPW